MRPPQLQEIFYFKKDNLNSLKNVTFTFFFCKFLNKKSKFKETNRMNKDRLWDLHTTPTTFFPKPFSSVTQNFISKTKLKYVTLVFYGCDLPLGRHCEYIYVACGLSNVELWYDQFQDNTKNQFCWDTRLLMFIPW